MRIQKMRSESVQQYPLGCCPNFFNESLNLNKEHPILAGLDAPAGFILKAKVDLIRGAIDCCPYETIYQR